MRLVCHELLGHLRFFISGERRLSVRREVGPRAGLRRLRAGRGGELGRRPLEAVGERAVHPRQLVARRVELGLGLRLEARERVEMRKCDIESRVNSKLSEKAEAAEEKKLEEEEDEDIAALTKGRRGAPPKKGDGKKKKKKKKPGDGGGKEK